MLRDKDKDEEVYTPVTSDEDHEGIKVRWSPDEAPVEEVALEDLEPVDKPVIVEEVVAPVAPVSLLSEAEQETALAWEMVEKMKAKEAAKKSANTEDASVAKAAVMAARNAELAQQIEALYTVNVGVWNGLDNYECNVCPYATLDVELIKVHVRQHV